MLDVISNKRRNEKVTVIIAVLVANIELAFTAQLLGSLLQLINKQFLLQESICSTNIHKDVQALVHVCL